MQIRPKGYERQWSLKGNLVNVENNFDVVVDKLPRTFQEAGVVQLELMRRFNYEHPWITDKIRPHKVLTALRFLLKTPLYQKSNIAMNENWDNFNEGMSKF